jgi:hypothetical protein
MDCRRFLRLLLALPFLSAFSTLDAKAKPPNVVFILVDDLGVMDLSIETPG